MKKVEVGLINGDSKVLVDPIDFSWQGGINELAGIHVFRVNVCSESWQFPVHAILYIKIVTS